MPKVVLLMTVISTTAVLGLGVICYIESRIIDVICVPYLSNSVNDDTNMQLTDNPYDKYEEVLMQLADKVTPLILSWRIKGVETPWSPTSISVHYCCEKGLVCDNCVKQLPKVLIKTNQAVITALVSICLIRDMDEDFPAIFAFIVCMQTHREYRRQDPLAMTRSARTPSLMIASLNSILLTDINERKMRDYLVELFRSNVDRFEGKIDHSLEL